MFEEVFLETNLKSTDVQGNFVPMAVEDDWIVVGIHGGGERRLEASHPVFQLTAAIGFRRFFSGCLPLHGKRSPDISWDQEENDEDSIPTTEQFINAVYDSLLKFCTSKRVLFICHSGGGMTMQRIWHLLSVKLHPESLLICIGSGAKEPEHSALIGNFWSLPAYEKLGSLPILEKLHGQKRAHRMIHFWHKCCGRGGDMFLTQPEFDRLYGSGVSPRCFVVLGLRDQPFPPVSYLQAFSKLQAVNRVYLVNSDHYRYFADFWSETRRGILAILMSHVNLKKAADEIAAESRKARKPPPAPKL